MRLGEFLEEVILLTERASKFKVLKNNKCPLTAEEHEEVMVKKAVWHSGPHGEPQSAVWKSKNRNGKITYITNTHRAYAVAPTLKGAISKYHSFIKGTA